MMDDSDKSVRDDLAQALGWTRLRRADLFYAHDEDYYSLVESALARAEAELERLERLRDDLASDALDLRLMLKDNADLAEAEIEKRDRELARLKEGLRRIADIIEHDYVAGDHNAALVLHAVDDEARSLLASGLDTVQRTEGER